MTTPPVVRLANDIAEQFAHRPHDEAVGLVEKHITTFWDPRMRRQLDAEAQAQHVDLAPIALDAALALRSHPAPAPYRFPTVLSSDEGTTSEPADPGHDASELLDS